MTRWCGVLVSLILGIFVMAAQGQQEVTPPTSTQIVSSGSDFPSDVFEFDVFGGSEDTEYCNGNTCIPWTCYATPTALTFTVNGVAVNGYWDSNMQAMRATNNALQGKMVQGTVYAGSVTYAIAYTGGAICKSGTQYFNLNTYIESAVDVLQRTGLAITCDGYGCWYPVATWCDAAHTPPNWNPGSVEAPSGEASVWGWSYDQTLYRFTPTGNWHPIGIALELTHYASAPAKAYCTRN